MDRVLRVYHEEAVWDFVYAGHGGHPETQECAIYDVYRDNTPRSGPPTFQLVYWLPNAANPIPAWGRVGREKILYLLVTDAIAAARWPASVTPY